MLSKDERASTFLDNQKTVSKIDKILHQRTDDCKENRILSASLLEGSLDFRQPTLFDYGQGDEKASRKEPIITIESVSKKVHLKELEIPQSLQSKEKNVKALQQWLNSNFQQEQKRSQQL